MNKAAKFFDKFSSNKTALIVNAVMALLATAIYLSMHTMLGFIGFFTFKALPYILGALLIVSSVLSLVILLYKNNKVIFYITFCYNVIALLFSLGYFFGMLTHYKTFLLELAKILAVYLFIAIVTYLIFFHGKLEFKGKKAVSIVLCVVLIGGSILCFTDFKSLRINYNTEGAAVYAVGDEYQIVWTTRAKGSGWVEINGQCYYDEYAGQKRTDTTVHKVTVKQSVLDEAKSYTIKSQAMLSEQGFSGLNGYTVSKTYSFRPVDPSDGIQTYVLTDTHDYNNAPVKAASYFGDKTDFIVLAGDHVNFLDTSAQLQRILNLAHRATGGNIPVVFARGNHELKCNDSEYLDRYVGSRNEKFYYTFRLKNVWGVVLDMGEDHDDSWKEFYNTALYDGYRAEQIAFLDDIIKNKDTEYAADGVEYKIAISHINTAITNYNRTYMFDALVSLNERLNVIAPDVMLSGHLHAVYKINAGYEAGKPLFYQQNYKGKAVNETPDYLATGAAYPSVVCGRRSETQSPAVKENAFGYKYTGTALEFNFDEITARFTTQKKDVLFSVNAFDGEEYGKVIKLK